MLIISIFLTLFILSSPALILGDNNPPEENQETHEAASTTKKPLDWRAYTINASLEEVRKIRAPTKNTPVLIVPIRVFVVKGARADASRLNFELYLANFYFNGLDPLRPKGGSPDKQGSASCQIAFEFQEPAIEVDVPESSKKLLSYLNDYGTRDLQDGFYGNFSKLSHAEMTLLDAVGPASPGGVNIVYTPSLGGGHGYTYAPYILRAPLRTMEENNELPEGATAQDLFNAYKNTILLSNSADYDTFAHELGHALTGRGHVGCIGEESQRDPKGCAQWKGNLLLTGGVSGGADGILLSEQCQLMRGRIKRGLP